MSDQTRPNGQTQPGEDRARPSARAEQVEDQVGPDARAETRRRVTVRKAAGMLGTTVEGIRSRIKRGSLDSMRVDGTVYVLLSSDQADRAQPDAQSGPVGDQAHPGDQAQRDPSLYRLVDEQREMIDWLKREVERKDTILMQMARRIPELEPSRESPLEAADAPATAPGPGSGTPPPPEAQGPVRRRSLLHRFFGFE